MQGENSRLAMIKANADFVISQLGPLSDVDFGLNGPSVSWVEGFIERQRVSGADDEKLRISSVLACFLGEAIIAASDGAWAETESGDLGIRFANDNWCFPFAKVAKQFADGVAGGESISSFYNFATTALAKGLDTPSDGTAPTK